MIVHRHIDKRSRTEEPVELISTQGPGLLGGMGAKTYSVRYADGFIEDLFVFDQTAYDGMIEAAQALLRAFEGYGISMATLRNIEAKRKAEQQRREEALMRKAKEYQDRIFEQVWSNMFGHGSAYSTFRARDFGRFNDRKANPFDDASMGDEAFRRWKEQNDRRRPPPTPERTKALDKCRKLKRLADSSTFPGERDNANTQRRQIMAKHGILEHEL